MRVVSDESGTSVFVRQSWLNDAMMCPERSRLLAEYPESRRENDSAMMGTAVHKGIEAVLTGGVSSADDAGEFAVGWFKQRRQELIDSGRDVFVTNTNPLQWYSHIDTMAKAWFRDVFPHVEPGGLVEHQFCQQVATVDGPFKQPYNLFFEGTIDYIAPSPESGLVTIWDWKTSSRKYFEAEKQSRDVQSAVYVSAIVASGAADFPVNFKFGVMTRSGSSAGQIVTIHRSEEHFKWIVSQASSVVNSFLLAQRFLPEGSWMKNDQHHLCSSRWCPVWSYCKGSFLGHDGAEEA